MHSSQELNDALDSAFRSLILKILELNNSLNICLSNLNKGLSRFVEYPSQVNALREQICMFEYFMGKEIYYVNLHVQNTKGDILNDIGEIHKLELSVKSTRGEGRNIDDAQRSILFLENEMKSTSEDVCSRINSLAQLSIHNLKTAINDQRNQIDDIMSMKLACISVEEHIANRSCGRS